MAAIFTPLFTGFKSSSKANRSLKKQNTYKSCLLEILVGTDSHQLRN